MEPLIIITTETPCRKRLAKPFTLPKALLLNLEKVQRDYRLVLLPLFIYLCILATEYGPVRVCFENGLKLYSR